MAKITILLLKSKPREADRRVAGEQLGEVYKLILKQALELERVKRDMDNLTLQLNECKDKLEKRPESYTGAIRTPGQKRGTEDGRGLKSQEGYKGKTRTSISATDHVLLLYPRDKQENIWSMDTRLVRTIYPKTLKIGIRGRKPVSARGVLMRLATKIDVGILEQAIKQNEALKDTVEVMVSKLRNPRVIA